MQIVPMHFSHLVEADRIQRLVYPAPLQENITIFEQALRAEMPLSFVLAGDDGVAGYLLGYRTHDSRRQYEVGYEPQAAYNAAYIHDLSIHPAFRGQGFAQQLLAHLEQQTKMQGLEKLVAVAIENALGFWENQGFSNLGACHYHGQSAYWIEKRL